MKWEAASEAGFGAWLGGTRRGQHHLPAGKLRQQFLVEGHASSQSVLRMKAALARKRREEERGRGAAARPVWVQGWPTRLRVSFLGSVSGGH